MVDGCCEGLDSLGFIDGEVEGLVLGETDGWKVVGLKFGWKVGERLGMTVGMRDGIADVGPCVPHKMDCSTTSLHPKYHDLGAKLL